MCVWHPNLYRQRAKPLLPMHVVPASQGNVSPTGHTMYVVVLAQLAPSGRFEQEAGGDGGVGPPEGAGGPGGDGVGDGAICPFSTSPRMRRTSDIWPPVLTAKLESA